MKNILIIAAAQTVLIALTVAGTWFMFQATQPAAPVAVGEGAEAAPAVKADPIYISIDPAFVINMEDRGKMRFLQMQLEVMSRDSDVEELMDKYYTRIRNDLILSFDSLTMDDIRLTEGKTSLQERARVAINAVLLEEAEKEEAIEAVYFTKFVVQ